MSIPNQALQKLVQEIETQAIQAQRDTSVVKTTIAAKQRDIRLLELTATEVQSLPQATNVYEGVGKIYLVHLSLMLDRRFVLKGNQQVEKRLLSEINELKTEVTNLNKKLHYLETTHRNSKDHIAQILGSGR
ncbi:hypothetical protein MMC10_004934 [Thelotrema lepadinum]|nr:hypothetical protein [Thelotrema lepadinum]